MDFTNYKYINNDEYNKFIELFYNGESYYMKANSKKDLKKYINENKLNTKTRAFYMYLYFTRKDFNRNTDIKTSVSNTPDENLNHNTDIKTSSDEETSEENINHNTDIKPPKPLKPLIERGKGQLGIIKLHISNNPLLKLWYHDFFEDINNENLSKEELENIAEKILKWNIYKCNYRDA